MSAPCCLDKSLTVAIANLNVNQDSELINNWISGLHLGFNIPHVILLEDRSKAYIHFSNRNEAIKFFNIYNNICLGLDGTMKVEATRNDDGTVVEYPEPELSEQEKERRHWEAIIRVSKEMIKVAQANLRRLDYEDMM